jgi:hypothetical protein
VIRSMLAGSKKFVYFGTGLTTNGLARLAADFQSAVSRGSEFRLLLDGKVQLESFRSDARYKWLFEDCDRVKVRSYPGPVPHWLIIDGRDFRLEEPHSTGPSVPATAPEDTRSNTLILDCEPPLAKQLLETFDTWWNDGTPIDR